MERKCWLPAGPFTGTCLVDTFAGLNQVVMLGHLASGQQEKSRYHLYGKVMSMAEGNLHGAASETSLSPVMSEVLTLPIKKDEPDGRNRIGVLY